ncbi:vWA domain-containing protein [Spirochaeta dissipatitropha]
MTAKRIFLFFSLLIVLLIAAGATPLLSMELRPQDIRLEDSPDGGFYLYIRAIEGVQSILVVESTEDPDREAASYALRDPGNHPANAGEIRLLDGEVLEETRGQSLVSSTLREDPEFGQAFRIFIPYVTVYGYPWGRQGELELRDGSYINLRTFELPYADYTGAFQDNPFVLRFIQQSLEEQTTAPLEDGPFIPQAVESFREIAEESGTELRAVELPEDLVPAIEAVLENSTGVSLQLVIVLDTTQSMFPYMPELQGNLVSMLEKKMDGEQSREIGVVFFRDYMEEYLTRIFPFTKNMSDIQNYVNRAVARGGRDIPEAVYEGLYAGLSNYAWTAEDRLIVLIGDAPPHPRPRGRVDAEMVFTKAAELGVTIQPILVAPY